MLTQIGTGVEVAGIALVVAGVAVHRPFGGRFQGGFRPVGRLAFEG
jgi:hypothetical protein